MQRLFGVLRSIFPPQQPLHSVSICHEAEIWPASIMLWTWMQPSWIIHIPQTLQWVWSVEEDERRQLTSSLLIYTRILKQNTVHLSLLREIHYLTYLDRPVFLFCCCLLLFPESGPGAYESGIMVSKAVEIYIQGKLLKPAGKHVYGIWTWPKLNVTKYFY